MILSAVRQGLLEGGQRGLGGHVPQEAHDELDAQAELGLRVQPGPVQAADDGVEADPAAGVGLGIEEDLGVDDVLRAGGAEVGHGQVVEVLLAAQHRHALVVRGQERGQVPEGVPGAQLRGRGVRQGDAVARGEPELQLRLQGALEVQVQLRLGQPVDERRDLVGHSAGGLGRLPPHAARGQRPVDQRADHHADGPAEVPAVQAGEVVGDRPGVGREGRRRVDPQQRGYHADAPGR